MARPKNPSFAWLLAATTSGGLGEGISLSVLPLLMATVTRDPFLVGLLQTAAALPWTLFGLQAGAFVDRWDRARVLVVCDVVRAGLAGLLGLAVLTGLAEVTSLLVFAFTTSVATVMFRAADAAVLPSLVARDDLAQANGRLQAGQTVTASFIGPGLGGLIFTLAHSFPVAVQTAAFVISAACLRRLPRRATTTTPSGLTLRKEIGQGLYHLWRDRTLRTLATATTLQGAGTWMLMAVFVLYALETLGAPAAGYGLLITAYAVGSLAGTALSPALQARLGTRVGLTSSALLGGLSIVGLAATRTFVAAAAGMLFLGVAIMVLNISTVTLRQQHTPEHLLGRVSSAFNVLNVATASVVGPISGLIASHFGLPAALATAGITFCAAALLLAAGLRTPGKTDTTLSES